MSTKTVFSCALMLAMLEVCGACAGDLVAQAPAPYPDPGPAAELGPAPKGMAAPLPGARFPDEGMPPNVTPPEGIMAPAGPSGYITYHQPCCCGPLGANGLIQTELLVRTGFDLHIGGGDLANRVNPGYYIQGVGRSLFFDPEEIRAWTVELGLSESEMDGKGNSTGLIVDGNPSTIRTLHRTEASLAGGREYYLIGGNQFPGWSWRVGWDVGALWGTTRLDVNNLSPEGFERTNSWNFGMETALHSDVEISHGCCAWIAGWRVQWDYMKEHKLPIGHTDFFDLDLLLTFGARF